KAIKEGDVMVYEGVVNKEIVNYGCGCSKLLYWGKDAERESLGEEERNKMMVRLGKKGEIVRGLKGGDGFVFGGGGEEGEELGCDNMEFEIIAGIGVRDGDYS
ncbi:SAM-dependent methyltransferase, partial [Staphylococcus epidermidis]|uniref:SAM-dependent methyltransferase n=1 Tax=Staphylococcus epidermidis TaxID=1282 RepID=UPI0037D9E9F8